MTQLGVQKTALVRDFTGAFMETAAIRERASREEFHDPVLEDAAVLRNILCSDVHRSRKRAHVLYSAAAETLAQVAGSLPSGPESRNSAPHAALAALLAGLKHGNRAQRMAAAQGLGSLPVTIPDIAPRTGPAIPDNPPEVSWPELSWPALLELAGAPAKARAGFEGRTALVPLDESGHGPLLAVKMARSGERPEPLALEGAWMLELGGWEHPARFRIPQPLQPGGKLLFRLTSRPDNAPTGLCEQGWSLASIVPADYFAYPNDHRAGRQPDDNAFLECMGRNSLLLGHLSARGAVHAAAIPLFHNRTQIARRDDGGVYHWWREGRLDRWLQSCAYPNIGLSGPRDFEHFEPARPAGRALHRVLASQILSLLLVAGSRFRAKAPDAGQCCGHAVGDMRRLFDPELLGQAVSDIARQFHRGFSGRDMPEGLAPAAPGLIQRMIEEMGMDRHMLEFLRVEDQKRMTDQEFTDYLAASKISRHSDLAGRRGLADIPLETGPHLGAFNGAMSLPEILEFASCAAGLAVGSRFLVERSITFPENL